MSNNMKKDFDKTKLTRNQEYYIACWKEYNLSLKCLTKNNYDYDQCSLYFENYKTCKHFWGNIIADRRRNDIKPYLPLPEDRERVKAEYIKLSRK